MTNAKVIARNEAISSRASHHERSREAQLTIHYSPLTTKK
jgi:hypothetical protein